MRQSIVLWLVPFTWFFCSIKAASCHIHLRGRKLQARQYSLWAAQDIHSTLLQWQSQYPNLVRVTTAQESYGLPTAGDESDCPYDAGVGCLNYILTIQDYIIHPEGSSSSNALPDVLWSGSVHGDERVGPTAVMETASLLLRAAMCEAAYVDDASLHATCSEELQQEGITKRKQQWLARLVSTRRIVIVPTANALGYYQYTRTEGSIDVNRDFPFDYTDPTQCMQSIAARTLNEVFQEHLFQMALTFHGGTEMIGYEWGADSYLGVLSPDDTAQSQIAAAYSNYGGGWSASPEYLVGPMDRIIYTVKGGMEDWAYAGSWIPELVVQCQPTTFGGYAAEKTIYNDSTLRVFNMLVETSNDKTPSTDSLGTSLDVLSQTTSGNGHVSRNIRVALLSADIVEPYLQITGVDNLAFSTDILPLTERNCKQMNAIRVPQMLDSVTIEWTVGGVLEIDETLLYYGNWSNVSGVNCLSQPSNNLESILTPASMLTSTAGTGYFSKSGVTPTSTSLTGDSPLGPVFQANIDLTSFGLGDEVIVIAKARVDQSWTLQPSDIAPQVLPQSHIVNARTNPSWNHQSNGKIIQGRNDWYSVLPLTLIISDTTTLEDIFNAQGGIEETNYLVQTTMPSLAPNRFPTPEPTPLPMPATVPPTTAPPALETPMPSASSPLSTSPTISAVSPNGDPTVSPTSAMTNEPTFDLRVVPTTSGSRVAPLFFSFVSTVLLFLAL